MFSILGWKGPIVHICHPWCSAPYHCVSVALVCKQMHVLFLVDVSGRQCHQIRHLSGYLMFDFPWFHLLRVEAFFLTRRPCPQSGQRAHTRLLERCWLSEWSDEGELLMIDPSSLVIYVKDWALKQSLWVPPGRVGLKGEALWSYGKRPSRWKFFLSKVARSLCRGRHNLCPYRGHKNVWTSQWWYPSKIECLLKSQMK